MVCVVLSLKRVWYSQACPAIPERLLSGVLISISPCFGSRKDWLIFHTKLGYREMEAVGRSIYQFSASSLSVLIIKIHLRVFVAPSIAAWSVISRIYGSGLVMSLKVGKGGSSKSFGIPSSHMKSDRGQSKVINVGSKVIHVSQRLAQELVIAGIVWSLATTHFSTLKLPPWIVGGDTRKGASPMVSFFGFLQCRRWTSLYVWPEKFLPRPYDGRQMFL